MTKKLAAAGYDPSSLEERARVLAKARGLIDSEGRKRTAEDMEMDEDGGDEDWNDDDEDNMEVDGEGVSRKRSKTSSSIVPRGKRFPATDRQTAGLKDAQVRSSSLSSLFVR